MASIRETDEASAAVASAPGKRISLSEIEARIAQRLDFLGSEIEIIVPVSNATAEALDKLSICVLVMDNGFVVIGKSAPLSADNFNAELGKRFAYEDAIRQLWPLMAFGKLERDRG